MSDALPAVVTADPMQVTTIGPEQVDLIKRTICKGATDDELILFVGQCRRTRLDPFSRQIHAVKRWDAKAQREVMVIQVGIDGFRLIAQRTGERDGQDGPSWCGLDGVWHDVWIDNNPPTAARMVIWRKGQQRPYTGIAAYNSFVQTTKDGTPNQFWRRMADVMLAKVAEAQALRMAFPMELSGLYLPEEMADTPQDSPTPAQDTIGPEGAKWLRDLAKAKGVGLRKLCDAYLDRHEQIESLSRVNGRQIASELKAMPDAEVPSTSPIDSPPEVATEAPWQAVLNRYRESAPTTGGDCKEYIESLDAKLASEGRCRLGDLMAHVNRAAAVEQLPGDWASWSGPMIAASIDIAREFAGNHPKAK